MNDLKVCIVGCGAIGGLLASHLINCGARVTLLDRDEQLNALRTRGLSLYDGDELRWHHDKLSVTGDAGKCGLQDLVVIAVKAHQIPQLCPDIGKLFKPDTVVMTVQNGIPWWYFQNSPGEFNNRLLKSGDPDGTISKTISADRIVGCVAYPAAEIVEPGVIRHVEGTRFPLGELDGSNSERCQRISELFVNAGLKAPVLADIRGEIWLKSWGNLAFNPISALTRATMRQICQDRHTRAYVISLMTEAAEIAGRLGITFRVPLERRLQGAEKVGEHRTSMLQDLDARRRLELDAVLGSIIELGELTDVDIPNLRGLYALATLRDRINCA